LFPSLPSSSSKSSLVFLLHLPSPKPSHLVFKMSQTKTKFNMTTEASLNDNVDSLVAEAKNFAESSIFAELEQGEEATNKAWFHKFSGLTNAVEEEVVDKVKDIHMTFPKLLFKADGKGDRNKLEEGDLAVASIPAFTSCKEGEQQGILRLNILTLVVRRTQALVTKHGSALELLPQLFNRMEEKINSLEKKLEEKPQYDEATLLHMVREEIDKKNSEYDAKLKSVQDELTEVKKENAKLKVDNEKLEEDVDEARQRGMKGNIKLTCPPEVLRPARTESGRMESKTEAISRVLQFKTGAHIPPSSMMALHPLPGERNTHIIRVVDHSPGSGWEALASGMVTNRRHDLNGPIKKQDGTDDYFPKDEVYLNYQLTPARDYLLYQIRQARKAGHLWKFSVNQNGRITILKQKPPPRAQQAPGDTPVTWIQVKSVKHLAQLLPAASFPIGNPPRARGGARTPGINN